MVNICIYMGKRMQHFCRMERQPVSGLYATVSGIVSAHCHHHHFSQQNKTSSKNITKHTSLPYKHHRPVLLLQTENADNSDTIEHLSPDRRKRSNGSARFIHHDRRNNISCNNTSHPYNLQLHQSLLL